MFIGYPNRVSRAEGAGDYVDRIARHLPNEVSDQFDVEISGVGSGCRLVGKAEPQRGQSIDSKVLWEFIKILPPHETRRASANAMDENQRRPAFLRPRCVVESAGRF